MSDSSLSALTTGLVPVLFILVLGFFAARARGFDPDQTTGFGNLVVNYTLPATLFIAIIKTSRSALVGEWLLLLVIALTFSLMFAIGYVVARTVFHRTSGEAAIAGLLVGSPGVPFFGTTILGPLFGASSTITVALVAVVVNVIQVPVVTILLVRAAASTSSSSPKTAPSKAAPATAAPSKAATSPAGGTVKTAERAAPPDRPAPKESNGKVVLTALKAPMVVAPLLALVLVLIGVRVPSLIDAMLTPLGQATSGVAVFVAGLTLGAQKLSLSWEVGWNVVAKMLLMPAVVFGAILLFGLTGTSAREVAVSSAIMSTTIGVILASHYKTYIQQASSTLLLTAVAMFLVLPLALSVASVIHA